MENLIKQLRDSRRSKDGVPMPPTALDVRAADALQRMYNVVLGLERSNQTMEKELSDAQITITKQQIIIANLTKELENAKKGNSSVSDSSVNTDNQS